ncbi:hypothetical protein HYT52_00905 [Candidatus Woesearchaeota archaeon]|nr:hypothetical protein [Candidatus Woesearchaeota archaeon]
MVKKITNLRNSGVKIGQLDVDIITQVRNNPGSETMVANLGQGISEHVHGKSLYFVSNANLKKKKKKHKIKHPAFFVK